MNVFPPIGTIVAYLKSIKAIISNVSRLEDAAGDYLNFVLLNSL